MAISFVCSKSLSWKIKSATRTLRKSELFWVQENFWSILVTGFFHLTLTFAEDRWQNSEVRAFYRIKIGLVGLEK